MRAFLVFALVLSACSGEAITVQTRAFQRPSRVAFVCYDLAPEGAGAVAAAPLESCTASDDTRFRLHALVLQESRGEVGAVDIDDNEVLDSDARIPGYTFVPVGEIPVGLAVPRTDPSHTYVADRGTMDVRAIETARFHPTAATTGAMTGITVALPAPPSDLVIGPSQALTPESALYVPLPEMGSIARIELPVTESSAPALIMLTGGDAFSGNAAVPEPTPYCKACPSDRDDDGAVVPCRDMLDAYPTAGGMRQPFPAREPVYAGTTPEPVAAIVDEENGRLLVADHHLPIIHVIDLSAPDTPQPPIVVGVPTEQLALTPKVPSVVGATEATERFLYAIDATDGSVLAVRYDEDDPSASPVLPVSVRGDADRIGLRAPARVIEVISPGFPGSLCDAGSGGTEAEPLRLHGVFLAAALLDGTVEIVDVHDLDATCRGGNQCEMPPDADDTNVYIQRHRPRIGVKVTAGITLVSSPTISTGGISYVVGEDGTTEGEITPDLGGLDDCPAGMERAFPFGASPAAQLVCALADPWAAESETWVATWEGTLPGTEGGLARFSLDSPTVTVEVDACARGVLGSENLATVPSAAPEAAYAPDLFVVTGEIPPSVADDAPCRGQVLDPEGDLALLDFPIVRAENVTNAEGEIEHVLTLAGQTRGGVSLDSVRACFPELTGYAIRSQGAYTVVGSRSGYRHRVTADADGLCTVSPSLPADRIGKARPGVVYDNSIVRFVLTPTGLGRLDEAALSFQIAQTPAELVIPIGDSLPTVLSDVAFNAVDGNLYVVDTAFAGLVQLTLDPVRVGLGWD